MPKPVCYSISMSDMWMFKYRLIFEQQYIGTLLFTYFGVWLKILKVELYYFLSELSEEKSRQYVLLKLN